MARQHTYETVVTWTGNLGTGTSTYRGYSRDHEVTTAGTSTYRGYSRDHEVTTAGPVPLAGSSDAAFRGDRTRWNPEQLLVASLSQCHMLWYLHLCVDAGVVVTDYVDQAVGTMTEDGDGGRFTEVVLRPRVVVADPAMTEPATRLHAEAHRKCYIANSVNFPVRHEPAVSAVATRI